MLLKEGGKAGSWSDKHITILTITASITNSLKGGGTAQQQSKGSSDVGSESDQNVGKIGPLLGEWQPEKFARMSAEF